VALLESELEQLLANSYAAGIINAMDFQFQPNSPNSSLSLQHRENGKSRQIRAILGKANDHRQTAEMAAYNILERNKCFVSMIDWDQNSRIRG